MEQKLLSIINTIRVAKGETPLLQLKTSDKLREDLGLTSFDLAEITVNLEDEYITRKQVAQILLKGLLVVIPVTILVIVLTHTDYMLMSSLLLS